MILDGGSPGSAVTSTSSLPSLSGRSCGSTTTLTALSQDVVVEKVDNSVDSLNNENINPNIIVELKDVEGGEKGEEERVRGTAPRRGIKRRSLSETGEMARPLQVTWSILKIKKNLMMTQDGFDEFHDIENDELRFSWNR